MIAARRDRDATGTATTDATMVPDYYARLGVDPGADRAEIEAALQRMQPAWSMGTRNPKTRHANQLYPRRDPRVAEGTPERSDLARGLRRRAGRRPDRRAGAEARRAATAGPPPRRQGRAGRVRPRAPGRRGGPARAERGRPGPAHPADPESRRGRRAANGDAELDHDPPADVLDPSTRRQIRVALEHLGCRDLYDALGVTRDAPASYIAARADAERQRWMKKAQVTAEKTAWLEVIAHAPVAPGLAPGAGAVRSDLGPGGRGGLRRPGRVRAQGLGRLDPGTRAALIDEAAALGIASDRADRLIGRICRRAGRHAEQGSAATPPRPRAAAAPPRRLTPTERPGSPCCAAGTARA